MEVKNLDKELSIAPIDDQAGIKLVKMTGDAQISVYAAEIAPHTKLNPHYHKNGIETYSVDAGKGIMKIGNFKGEKVIWKYSFEANTGDFFSIQANEIHQIANESDQVLRMIFTCPESHVGDDRHFVSPEIIEE